MGCMLFFENDILLKAEISSIACGRYFRSGIYFRLLQAALVKCVAYYERDVLSRLAHVPNWSGHDPRRGS